MLRRHGPVQRGMARCLLVCFLHGLAAGPIHAADSFDSVIGTGTSDAGRVLTNTDDHLSLGQETANTIWNTSDLQQPAGHHLEMVQQEGDSVLIQMAGENPANFWGRVSCDATCILANGAGIYFNDGSHIDVFRLIAVAGDIARQDFLTHNYDFTGIRGEVANFGRIEGDSVALIGQRVSNFGEIHVRDGTLAMLAGDQVQLREHGSPLVIQVDLPVSDGDELGPVPAVENGGTIDAGMGSVRMRAGDMLAYAIRHNAGATIRAADIRLEGGDGGVVEVHGDLDASNTRDDGVGGRIEVLGDHVAVLGDAELDASGTRGGGTIRVGGDRQGRGETRRARTTYVGKRTRLVADALKKGDGGDIIVWSDHTTRAYGTMLARGGPKGGDGGFVETSGKHFLDVAGLLPDVRARSGRRRDHGGEWLLDPFDIEIVAAGDCGTTGPCLDDELFPDPTYFPEFDFDPLVRPTGDFSQITADQIALTLLRGSDVTITTSEPLGFTGFQDGDITLNAPLRLGQAGDDALFDGLESTLTLIAANSIILNDVIENNVSGFALNLDFTANDSEQIQNTPTNGLEDPKFIGDIELNRSITTGGGDITLDGVNLRLASGATIRTDGGRIEADIAGGDIVLDGNIDTCVGATCDDDDAGGLVAMNAAALLRQVVFGSDEREVFGGDITVRGDIQTEGAAITLTAGEPTLLSAGGSLILDGELASNGGEVRLNAFRAFYNDDGETQEVGGRVLVTPDAAIRTRGGAARVVTNAEQSLDGDTGIRIYGEIDTGDGDATEAGDGGAVSIVAGSLISGGLAATRGEVVILDLRPGSATGAQIRSDGGDFTSTGGDSFHLDGAIDTTSNDPESDGGILISHSGNVELAESFSDDARGGTYLAADESISLQSDRNVEFGARQAGGIAIGARQVRFRAGDDVGGRSNARVVGIDQIRLRDGAPSAPDANPELFSLVQDASLASGDVPLGSFAQSTLPGGETLDYALRSADGSVTVATRDVFADSDLSLQALDGVAFDEGAPAQPLPDLASLDILVTEDFTVDPTLAGQVSDKTPDLTIASVGELTIADDLSTRDDANSRMLLQGGAGNLGDLDVEGVVLTAANLTLQAGDGSGFGSSRVVLDGNADFRRPSSATMEDSSFVLRQSAAIDESTIPSRSQFTDATGAAEDITGLDYALRSDAADITISDSAKDELANTDLSLHALTGITLDFDPTASPNNKLIVESLDIGGLTSFTYSRTLNDRIDADEALIIRAGLESIGNLAFDGSSESEEPEDFIIESNEIRLFAGDGRLGTTSSSIVITPINGSELIFRGDGGENDPIETFSFRQDAALSGITFPRVGAGLEVEPGTYILQSNDGDLSLNFFQKPAPGSGDAEELPTASEWIVLGGQDVDLIRRDGEDLDLDLAFGLSSGGTQLQVRADAFNLEANIDPLAGDDETSQPEIIPGSNLVLYGYTPATNESVSDSLPNRTPRPIDPAVTPDFSPVLVQLLQIGSTELANLIDLGDASILPNGVSQDNDLFYVLTSEQGGIRIGPSYVKDTDLILFPRGEGSTVVFDSSGADFEVRSLNASTPPAQGGRTPGVLGDWVIENSGSGGGLTIIAEDFIALGAGKGGAGNLTFGPNVVLQSPDILLEAGLRDQSSGAEPQSVVDAFHNDPEFVFPTSGTEELTTSFTIRQDGSFVDQEAELPAPPDEPLGVSVIPDPDQIQDETGARTKLDGYSLISEVGNITIRDLETIFPDPSLVPEFLVVEAGRLSPTLDGTITLGDLANTDDLDLSLLENAVFVAVDIQLIAGDGQVVKAEEGPDDDISFQPLVSFRVQQTGRGFAETGDCSNGCLPKRDQFTGSTIGQRYLIDARNGGNTNANDKPGQIVLDANLADKLLGTQLTLRSDNALDGNVDVTINSESLPGDDRIVDVLLTSLIVGDTSQPLDIRFESGTSSSTDVATAGNQIYYGDVELGDRDAPPGTDQANVAFNAELLQFAGNLRSAPDTEARVVVNSRGQARFDGDVELATDSGSETVESLLRFNFDPTAVPIPTVHFGVNTLTDPNGYREGQSPQTVEADRIEAFVVPDLAKPDEHIQREATIATIFKPNERLTIRAKRLTMGSGERMTVADDLVIEGIDPGGAAELITLADVSALTLRATADEIRIVRRDKGEFLRPDGQLEDDAGTDLVANTIQLIAPEVYGVGDGRDPSFAVADPERADSSLNRFTVTAINADFDSLERDDFASEFSPTLLDLHPAGPSRDNLANAPIAVEGVPQPGAWIPDLLLPADLAPINRLSIHIRSPRPSEYRSAMAGAMILDDVGADVVIPGRPDVLVVEQRLLAQDARSAAKLHELIFRAEGQRIDEVRATLQAALDRYRALSRARRVLGFEFRRYLRNRPSSEYEAYAILELLDDLFAQHRQLGLTPGEYKPIQESWLERIKPEGITTSELSEAIHPSRFIRGSDILDIFGE